MVIRDFQTHGIYLNYPSSGIFGWHVNDAQSDGAKLDNIYIHDIYRNGVDWKPPSKTKRNSHSIPKYVIIDEQKQNHKTKTKIKPRSMTTTSRISLPELNNNTLKKESSKYDILPNADIECILHELIGYDILNINDAITSNDYIKSNIDSILSYKYGALSLSHIKQFKPPLNDISAEIKYFRNIAYK